MISLHVLATKFGTKSSVPIDTPIPMKPSVPINKIINQDWKK
jgi:hypothetical protein